MCVDSIDKPRHTDDMAGFYHLHPRRLLCPYGGDSETDYSSVLCDLSRDKVAVHPRWGLMSWFKISIL